MSYNFSILLEAFSLYTLSIPTHMDNIMQKHNKTFKFYNDPGHGWLAVKVDLLKQLCLVDKISTYSYIKGKTAYLEEDCDAGLFISVYRKNFGHDSISFDEKSINVRSPIRSYDVFTAQKANS